MNITSGSVTRYPSPGFRDVDQAHSERSALRNGSELELKVSYEFLKLNKNWKMAQEHWSDFAGLFCYILSRKLFGSFACIVMIEQNFSEA